MATKVRVQLLVLVPIAVLAFLAGSWLTFQGTRPAAAPERKILHYVDPMNPALKFDSPGIAPCGMPREPVYADQAVSETGGAGPLASLPPGTIRISPEKQQLIGVKTMTVEKAPWTHTLRALGRVTPDETRVYRINAATEGWIEKTMPITTGSQVKENELLATLSFFSLEYRTLVQNYFNLLNLGETAQQSLEPLVNNPQYSPSQLQQMRKAARYAGNITDNSQIDYFRKSLYNYGISPYQLKEMERTRTFPEVVEIRAPAAGFVVFRNVSPGLRLARGDEIFRIADLSRVWVLADIFENEASYFKPGMAVKMELPYRKMTVSGRVSPVLPQFDPATRTLKMRLVADNPGFVLRPDMFVNLEIPLSGPAAIVVPVDAVIDSGLKKTVFVAREGGYFEPRPVETGRHLGERVEIVRGLMAGERIVVAGNFLLDSEARIQQAAAGITGNVGRDPVCGMNIDADRAKAEGRSLEYKGKTYSFCEPQCREDFRKEPERYLAAPPAAMPMPGPPQKPAAPVTPAAKATVAPRTATDTEKAHGGMAMPAVRTPAASMQAMPETAPTGKSKAAAAATALPGVGATPPPDSPDTSHPSGTSEDAILSGAMPANPGSPAALRPARVRRVPERQGATPQPGETPGEIAPPPSPAPPINLRSQRYGAPGVAPQQAPIRRPRVSGPALPAGADPALKRTSPSLPTGPESALPPGAPGTMAPLGPDRAPLPDTAEPPALPSPGAGAGMTPPTAPGTPR